LLIHYTKGTMFSIPLVSITFKYFVLFHKSVETLLLQSITSVLKESFHHSLTVLFTIDNYNIFLYRGWVPYVPTKRSFIVLLHKKIFRRIRESRLFEEVFNQIFTDEKFFIFPISLTTTFEISVDFFSYSYWDVSLHCVVGSFICCKIKTNFLFWIFLILSREKG